MNTITRCMWRRWICCVRRDDLKKHIEGVHKNIWNFEHDSFPCHALLQVILFWLMQFIHISHRLGSQCPQAICQCVVSNYSLTFFIDILLWWLLFWAIQEDINQYHDMLYQKGVTWRNTLKECTRAFETLNITHFLVMHCFKWSLSDWCSLSTLLTDLVPNVFMQFVNVLFQITL